MTGFLVPLASDFWQVFTLDLVIDGEPLQVQTELRYLPAPDRWYVSLRDQASGELLVNMIPLICSYGQVNDRLLPFRHLRNGRGLGSLFCLQGTEETETEVPVAGNLEEFVLCWSDTYG